MNIVKDFTLTFGADVYHLKSLDIGVGGSVPAVDVTCLDDSVSKYIKGAAVSRNDITATISGAHAPAINTPSTLSIVSGGIAIVEIENAVVKSVTGSTIEAGGNREITWDVVISEVSASEV